MAVEWNGNRILGNIRQAAMRGVVRYIGAVETRSVELLMSPPKTGKMYGKHQASAPGEAPASDTGRLVNSRTVDLFEGTLTARLTYRTAYAAALEFGTEKMEPRPFLARSLDETRAEGQAMIAQEIKAALK